jgi:hypothetical protein
MGRSHYFTRKSIRNTFSKRLLAFFNNAFDWIILIFIALLILLVLRFF